MKKDNKTDGFSPGRLFTLLLLLIAGILAYYNSFEVPLQFDDLPNISNNANTHMVELSANSLIRAARGPNTRRPLSYLSFGINYYIHRNEVFGYHLVNFLLHLGNAFLVYLLGRRVLALMMRDMGKGELDWSAFGAAVLFLVHPVQTQAVSYIVQRMTSMSTFFSLASILLYIEARMKAGVRSEDSGKSRSNSFPKVSFLAGSALFMAGAFLTKENTFILPYAILAMEGSFLGGIKSLRASRPRLFLGGVAVLVLVSAGLAAHFWPGVLEGYKARPFTMEERLLTQPRVIFHYISLIVWPLTSRFHLDYAFPFSTSLLTPVTTIISIAGLGGLLGFAWLRRRKEPLAAFAILWFLGMQIIESSIVPLEMVFEHRVYLPSFGLFLLFSTTLIRLAHSKKRMPVAAVLLALLSGALIWATHARNEIWRDPVKLFSESADRSPDKARAHLNVGWSQYYAGNLEEAEKAFQRVLEINPGHEAAINNLGNIYRDRGDFEKAANYYTRAMEINPKLPDPALSLAAIFINQRRFDEARQVLDRILKADPKNSSAHVNLGVIYSETGDKARARNHFDRAIELDPGHPKAYLARAGFLAKLKLGGAAMEDVAAALRIAPKDPEILLRAAIVSEEAGKPEEALRLLQEALTLNPDMPGVNFRIGNLYVFKDDLDKAEKYYLAEINISPHSEAWNNLGNIAWSRNKLAKAEEYYLKALQIDRDNKTAKMNIARLKSVRRR